MRFNGNEKGFTLIEVLIAILFFMIIVGGILMAISTSSRVLAKANNQEIAKDVAAGVMEYIRTLPYAPSYPVPSPPAEYSNFQVNDGDSTVVPTFLRTNEQQIDIVVKLQGKVIFTLTDYRTKY